MTIDQVETGEQLPSIENGDEHVAEVAQGVRVPVEDVISRVGQVALPNVPIDTSDPERFEQLSHPTDVYQKIHDKEEHRVYVDTAVSLEDRFRQAREIGPWAVRDLEVIIEESEPLRGAAIGEVNPTAKGGGVQEWIKSGMPIARELGGDVRWLLMPPDPLAFIETKGWHNSSQGAKEMTIERFRAGLPTYDAWIDSVAEALGPQIAQLDLVRYNDPQPHGLYLQHLREYPHIPTEWQGHIQFRNELIDTPGTIQWAIWENVWNGKVEHADLFAFHPVDSFVPSNVPRDRLTFEPAPFNPLDDLNREVTEEEKAAKREFWDHQLRTSAARKLAERPDGLPSHIDYDSLDYSQEEINWGLGYAAAVARFDLSKGFVSIKDPRTQEELDSILEYYALHREMMIAEGEKPKPLILAGNGSIDDPDGDMVVALVMHARQTKYADFKDDIKVLRVAHDDLAINVLMEYADYGIQPSRWEGFENRVTEWIWHKKPVLVSSGTGMPLQVVDGQSGFILDPNDRRAWATRMTQLALDREKYDEMIGATGKLSRTYNYREFAIPYAEHRKYRSHRRVLRGEYQGDLRWRSRDTLGPISEAAKW